MNDVAGFAVNNGFIVQIEEAADKPITAYPLLAVARPVIPDKNLRYAIPIRIK
ncbi:MAG: hypothetical protein WA192_12665 [Candidatus Acidiferrales bacterium]